MELINLILDIYFAPISSELRGHNMKFYKLSFASDIRKCCFFRKGSSKSATICIESETVTQFKIN